jgi:acyl-CoA reductase-like NAD-dependent aldehyde dehydrogenase
MMVSMVLAQQFGRAIKSTVSILPCVQSGIVWMIRYLDVPFAIASGGAKQSGIGRQPGLEGMKEYIQVKILRMSKSCGIS